MAAERVLVVDDEAAIVNVVAEALRLSGYEPVGVGSAEAALERLAEQKFDLVVTDVMMPGLSGLELLRRIRVAEPNVVVVVVTGKATLDVAIEALESGAHAFLIKPFTPSELRRTIASATQKARLSEETARLRALEPLLDASRHYVSAVGPAELAELVAGDARRLTAAQESVVVLAPGTVGAAGQTFGDEQSKRLAAQATVLWELLSREPSPGAIDTHVGAGADALPVRLIPLVGSERLEGMLAVGFTASDSHDRNDSASYVLDLLAQHAGAALENARVDQERESLTLGLATALANALDARDTETGDHCQRLMDLSVALGREIGLGPTELEHLRYGALLHDIGKIGIPDDVLRKPSRLSDDEWAVMRQHTIIGERILAPLLSMRSVAEIVRYHHEHFDGRGYPDGLTRDDIPLMARSVAVVDAYCTMTEDRPYQRARSHLEAIEELLACAGAQFDPSIVDAFLRLFDPPSGDRPTPVSGEAMAAADDVPLVTSPRRTRRDGPAR
jgi:putative nucleotidyltransferase with HDIG domain